MQAGGVAAAAVMAVGVVPSAVSWRRTGRTLRLDATVPPGTTARVEFPLFGGTVRPDAPKDAKWVGVENDRAVFQVGSGDWTFEGAAK